MRIFVSNLSYQVTAEELQAVFIAYHKVESVFIIKDRATGKSKGFGYVDITPDSEAKAAIEELTGKILQDRPLVLKVALPPAAVKAGASQAPPKRGAKGPVQKVNRGGRDGERSPQPAADKNRGRTGRRSPGGRTDPGNGRRR